MDGKLSGSFQSSSGGAGGTVTAVTATAPLASSGGATPNITLTGTVLNGVNAQIANYLAVAGDDGKLISFNSAAGVQLTLPAAPPSATWAIVVQNVGAGSLAVSPNALLIDGNGGNVNLSQTQGMLVFTDGANYFTSRGKPVIASSARLGIVQPDGVIITISGAGAITVPKATNAAFGVVEVDGTTITAVGGVISAAGGGSVPGMVQLGSQILGAPAATVNFSAIPATYSHLLLVATCRSDHAAATDGVYMQVNADVAAHYIYLIAFDIPSSSNSAPAVGALTATPEIAAIPGSSQARATLPGNFQTLLQGYAGTTFDKFATTQNSTDSATGVLTPWSAQSTWYWESTAAINEILVGLTSGGNFIAGSQFTLYGLL